MRPVETCLESPSRLGPLFARHWQARLELEYARQGARTVLAARRHRGPLLVQKPLYPEGEAVCHGIVLHPPAGLAGGDLLELAVEVGAQAHALLTTPGAGKWYRSLGPSATQRLRFRLSPGAALEWLPQESIVFDAADARMEAELRLAGDACYLGWEVLCLGRTGAGERLTHGALRLAMRIFRDDAIVFEERGLIEGSGRLLAAPVGLAGQPVCATLLACAPGIDAALLAACRQARPRDGQGAATRLPGLLVARYLGPRSDSARAWFVALWRILRPALLGRVAVPPRIWST